MIRQAEVGDVEGIVELVSAMLPTSILANISKGEVEANIKNGTQISYIFEYGGKISGHISVFSRSNVGVLGNIAVLQKFRRQGISKKIMLNLEEHCKHLPFTHLIGYTLLQNDYSQRLFGKQYVPIGVALSEANQLNPHDKLYDSKKLNGEVVLCKPVGKKKTTSFYPHLGRFEDDIKTLYKSVNIDVKTRDYVETAPQILPEYFTVDLLDNCAPAIINDALKQDYNLLGIQPSGNIGMNLAGFVSKEYLKRYSQEFIANVDVRKEFVLHMIRGEKHDYIKESKNGK